MASLPSWALLARVPRRSNDGDPPRYLTFDLKAPPAATYLTIAADMFINGKPCIVASNDSGGLLISSSSAGGVELHLLAKHPCYPTATIARLPTREPFVRPINDIGGIGLTHYSDGLYLVAHLQPEGNKVRLFRLHVLPGVETAWCQTVVPFPFGYSGRKWRCDQVACFRDRIWWINLTLGFITCGNLRDTYPIMSFETLPGDGVNEDVHRYRYVGVSAGKLRFIEMVNVSSEEKAAVSVWTHCGDDNLFARWTRQSTTVFSEVWSHRSYLDTGLPQSVPEAIAFAHPLVPDNVFFIQHGHLIRLDVAAKRVVELTPDRCTSSSDFLPWIFPPSLASDFYPRYSGLLTLSGCQVHMMHLSQTDLLIQAEFLVVGNVRATAVQIVMRVWTKHKFNELVIIGNKDNHSSSSDQAISAVSFRRFALQPMRMTILPLKDAIIRVPVPVFGNIFRAYGLVEELISSTGPTVLQGKRIPRGYYIGGPWMVQFIEIHNVPADPVMLLMFYHHGFETFAAQLREWPNFHHVKIYQGSYRPDMYDVTLAYLEDSDEESIQDVPHAIRMVPLPFLSQISAYFDDE